MGRPLRIPVKEFIFSIDFSGWTPAIALKNKLYHRSHILLYINFNFALRYFKIDGIGDTNLWETSIKNYGFEKLSEQPVSLDSITSKIAQENLNLSEQCTLLSAFPNYHHLTSKKTQGVKKDKYFITKWRSLRNKAMSLGILANNVEDLSEENEYFTVNISTIVKLVL